MEISSHKPVPLFRQGPVYSCKVSWTVVIETLTMLFLGHDQKQGLSGGSVSVTCPIPILSINTHSELHRIRTSWMNITPLLTFLASLWLWKSHSHWHDECLTLNIGYHHFKFERPCFDHGQEKANVRISITADQPNTNADHYTLDLHDFAHG